MLPSLYHGGCRKAICNLQIPVFETKLKIILKLIEKSVDK